MRRSLTALALALVLTGARTASAESASSTNQSSGSGSAPRVRGYVVYGATSLAASKTFDAVAGSTRATTFGGGVQVVDLWKRLFIDAGFSRQGIDGERVFVSGGTVYPLGIPLQVHMLPLDVVAGWRVQTSRVTPYVGGGVTSIGYRESSDFAAGGDDVSERATGAVVLAGVDVPLARAIAVGGEVRYRHVTGVLGEGGASAAFGEDSIGGLQYAVRVTIGR